jgi:hypothetical protein
MFLPASRARSSRHFLSSNLVMTIEISTSGCISYPASISCSRKDFQCEFLGQPGLQTARFQVLGASFQQSTVLD